MKSNMVDQVQMLIKDLLMTKSINDFDEKSMNNRTKYRF